MTINRGYYVNGQLHYEESFQEDNRLHGISRWWHPNGKLRYEATYQEGKLHGVARWWFENGQQQSEYPYQEGKMHGLGKNWGMSGDLTLVHYFLYNDKVTEKEYRKHEAIRELAGI